MSEVLREFPDWLEKRAKAENVTLQPWQRQIAEAFAGGSSVKVYASPGQRAGKQWLYDNLRRFLRESDKPAEARHEQATGMRPRCPACDELLRIDRYTAVPFCVGCDRAFTPQATQKPR